MSKKRPPDSSPQKSREQAEHDCDWIALYDWDWWRAVVTEAENRASSASREDQ